MNVVGVLWHSTGANNTTLKRYVQPDDREERREELLKLLGKNTYGNDWNHVQVQAGVNAWIGTLEDGTITTVQTLPWDMKPWGCGGACNNGWIQFEICEDNLTNKTYFNKVYKEACELTAYLCTLYNIDPNGTVLRSNKRVPTILCHQDSYRLGMGSNHADVYHWFNKYGKTMDDVRKDVAKLMKGGKVDDVVTEPTKPTTPTTTSKGNIGNNGLGVYKVIANDGLNIRSGPGTNHRVVGCITDNGSYTIVDTDGSWGKLKSGAGWVSLNYCVFRFKV